MIIVDTPASTSPHDALGEELNTSAIKALEDVDVVAMLIDSSKPIGRGDEWVAAQVKRSRAKKICVLSKTDCANDSQISAQRGGREARRLGCDGGAVLANGSQRRGLRRRGRLPSARRPCMVSARHGNRSTPRGHDRRVRSREDPASFRDEVPYAIGVQVEELEFAKGNLARIYAVITKWSATAKRGIIIGKKGAALNQIGTEARADLEHLLGTRVFLDLRVKVKKNWRRDASQIRRFGYGEGL